MKIKIISGNDWTLLLCTTQSIFKFTTSKFILAYRKWNRPIHSKPCIKIPVLMRYNFERVASISIITTLFLRTIVFFDVVIPVCNCICMTV